MSQNRFIFFLIITYSLFFSNGKGYSQFYQSGEDPASVKWSQIKTNHFQVIFPKDFYSEANRFTNLLEKSYGISTKSLIVQPKRVPVILHNYSVQSNAFVSWAPKRMEVVTTPPVEMYPEDWLEQLSLHEFRHVIQISKLNRGFTRAATLFFGQVATGADIGFIPLWFMEGDAVINETALSNSGRGRVPEFEMGFRAITLEKTKRYSYDKSYYGSYKNFVPDYYHIGYLLTAYARLKNNALIWDKTLDEVGKKPFILAPFYFGLHRNMHVSKVNLYNEALDSLKYLWSNELNNTTYTSYSTISDTSAKYYTSYRFPQYVSNDKILVEKSGIDQISQFVIIDSTGNETPIFTPGYYDPVKLSVSANVLAWTEHAYDPRWSYRNYSVIKILGLKSNKVNQITFKSRYFSPALNNEADKIATIEIDPLNRYYLVILNPLNGDVIHKIPSPSNEYITQPDWTKDGNLLVMNINNNGEGFLLFDLKNNRWKTILEPSYTDISQPVDGGEYVYFRGAYSGIENIYAIRKSDKKIYQVTSSRYGAFDPTLNSDFTKLAYTDYHASGYRLVETAVDTSDWKPLKTVKNLSDHWGDKLAAQENNNIQNIDTTQVQYTEKPYSRLLNLFNFHSWAPFYIDYTNIQLENHSVTPGFMLFSQNKLGTAVSSISYSYQNGNNYFYPTFTYSGWYPVMEFSAKLGGPAWVYRTNMDSTATVGKISSYRDYTFRWYLPLNFTNNKYVKYLQPSVKFEYFNAYHYDVTQRSYKSGVLVLQNELWFQRYLKLSHRDLHPKWGQTLYLNFTNSPSSSSPYGNIFSLETDFYFPGLLKHQNLKLGYSYEKQNPKDYLFSSRIKLPRGYPDYPSIILKKFTLDYSFPLIYPDLSIGPVTYIKRIRANLFMDIANGSKIYDARTGTTKLYTGQLTSFGSELVGDMNLFRFIFPFSIGVRYSYLPTWQKSTAEFLLTINTSAL